MEVVKLKATAIVRRIDDLGRVPIPKAFRHSLGLSEGDAIEIHIDGNRITLLKNNTVFQGALRPKDLTADKLHDLVNGHIEYLQIMDMYGFTSVRYFKDVIKALGYRMRHDVLKKIKVEGN